MLDWLKDLLSIYTWKEFWLVMIVPTSITGVWFLFSFLLSIPNDILRAVAIWVLFLGLSFGAATVDALRKRQK